ncbi:MAG: hypothetical protein ABI779_19530 [Acidobacteriota bacterium]
MNGFPAHLCENEINARANGALLASCDQVCNCERPIHAAIAEGLAAVDRILNAGNDLDVARAGDADGAGSGDLGEEVFVDLRLSSGDRFVGAKRVTDALRAGVEERALRIGRGGILHLNGSREDATGDGPGDDGNDEVARGCGGRAENERHGEKSFHGTSGEGRKEITTLIEKSIGTDWCLRRFASSAPPLRVQLPGELPCWWTHANADACGRGENFVYGLRATAAHAAQGPLVPVFEIDDRANVRADVG